MYYDPKQTNMKLINTVQNLALNIIHEQIPDKAIIINGIILTKDILIKYMSSLNYFWTNADSNTWYPVSFNICYNSPLNTSKFLISPDLNKATAFKIVFNQINN